MEETGDELELDDIDNVCWRFDEEFGIDDSGEVSEDWIEQ